MAQPLLELPQEGVTRGMTKLWMTWVSSGLAACFIGCGSPPSAKDANDSGDEQETKADPPAEQDETPPPRTVSSHVWMKGHWVRSHGRWVWIRGHYEAQRTGQVWVNAHWERQFGRWRFVPGHWRRV